MSKVTSKEVASQAAELLSEINDQIDANKLAINDLQDVTRTLGEATRLLKMAKSVAASAMAQREEDRPIELDMRELLNEILDSDMAQREEDEGRISPILEKVRHLLDQADKP